MQSDAAEKKRNYNIRGLYAIGPKSQKEKRTMFSFFILRIYRTLQNLFLNTKKIVM